MKKKLRDSNFELLRIVAMLFILLHHFALSGYFKYELCYLPTLLNNIFVATLLPLGKLGVALFVMLTGYYSVTNGAKIENFIKIYFQTWSYSILIFVLTLFLGLVTLSASMAKVALLPVLSKEYWFVSAYLLLYIFIPLINKILEFVQIKNIEIYFFIVTTIIFLFIHTNLIDFMYFYVLGAYLKCNILPLNKICLKFSTAGLLGLLFVLVIFSTFVVNSVPLFDVPDKMHKFMTIHSPFILIAALSIFIIFKNINIKANLLINNIALSTFTVYLIHENPILRPFLWTHVINILGRNSSFLIANIILINLLIFFGCILFDKLFRILYIPIQNKIIKGIRFFIH